MTLAKTHPRVRAADESRPVDDVSVRAASRVVARRWPRVIKLIRRVHLYLGLLLMPWLLLFGLTALSFNHPTVGRGLEGRMLPPSQLKELVGFAAWDAEQIAGQIVREMNGSGAGYTLNNDSAKFQGWPLLQRKATGGNEVVIVGLDQGRAILTKRSVSVESKKPPFFKEKIVLPRYSMGNLAKTLEPIHSKLGIETQGPLLPHPKIHPELRFQTQDPSGKSWNVIFNLSTGRLDGRATDEMHHAPVVELLESLHTQHHYPANFGPTFFWALFSDLTALTLLIWALTGLIMWWQMKKLRMVGIVFLLSAGVLATLVMGATATELTFGPERN